LIREICAIRVHPQYFRCYQNCCIINSSMSIRFKKSFSFAAAFALLAIFGFSISAQAQAPLGNLGLEYQANIGLGTGNILDMVATIINVLFGLLGTLAVVLILYGGFLYMTSAGERDKIDKAKKVLINAAIGLVIILSAYAIAAFIISQLLRATLGGIPRFGPGGAGYEAGSGAFGGGIIQAHSPKRNAVDVPRNTKIAITFKEEVKLDQIIAAGATSGNLVLPPTGGIFQIFSESTLNTADETDGTKGFVAAAVSTPDNGKTFVFKPNRPLGNTEEATVYTVAIKCELLKKNLTDAFGDLCNADGYGYKWTFQVSTRFDLTPPTVTSVIPRIENDPTKANARNIIVQMNFSEPIDPAAATGVFAAGSGFSNIAGQVLSQSALANPADAVAAGTLLGGKYEISNGYQTVEFTTDVICGVNSCGLDVYCMPSNANMAFTIKAPTLAGTEGQPFASLNGIDGINDMSGNGLDANEDGIAQGATVFDANHPGTCSDSALETRSECLEAEGTWTPAVGDSYRWSFFTNDRVDLIPPTVTAYGPQAGQEAVDPSTDITAKFDKLLSASSVKPDSNYGDGYCKCESDADCNVDVGESCSPIKKQCVDDADGERVACYTYLPTTCRLQPLVPEKDTIEEVCVQQEHVTVNQSVILPPTFRTWYDPGTSNTLNDETPELSYSTINTAHGIFLSEKNYGLNYGSGIKDLFQNCYIPNAAPGCPRVAVPGGKPGEFQVQTWPGLNYPSCDLSGSTLSTAGSFNLSYVTSRGQNRVQAFTNFASIQDAGDIYNGTSIAPEFDFLNDTLKPNTATFTLYNDLNAASETSGYYYLVALIQKPNPFTTALANPAAVGDATMVIQSTAGLPAGGGSIIINNSDEAAYTAKSADGKTLTGVTGIDSAHVGGESVQLLESGSFEFTAGPFPESANAQLIYPAVAPADFTVDASEGQIMYSASLNWSPTMATDAIIIQIDRGTNLLEFKVDPTSVSRSDMILQVLYAGGSVALPNDQLFEIIQLGTDGESVAPLSVESGTNDLQLTIDGSGTVNSSPSGASCGTDCLTYDSGTSVTLTPAPEAGASFTGWGGDCTGTVATDACVLVMNAELNVTAQFTQLFTVSVTTSGSGTVSGGPIDCGSTCSADILSGTPALTLQAIPDPGEEFVSWEGDCSGSGDCIVTIDQARNVTAMFQLIGPKILTIDWSGGGQIIDANSLPCPIYGTTCSQIYDTNDAVTLYAMPLRGYRFVGWGGECTGTEPCSITMDSSKTVNATFEIDYRYTTTTATINLSMPVHAKVYGLGFTCEDPSCAIELPRGVPQVLYTQPESGYFAQWNFGECNAWGSCLIQNNSNTNVAVVTIPGSISDPKEITLNISGTGAVIITSQPGPCLSGAYNCYAFTNNSVVGFSPSNPFSFISWLGLCSGTSSFCSRTITSTSDTTNTARFYTRLFTWPITGGSILRYPSGTSCGTNCYRYSPNTSLSLSASSSGTFSEFTGICQMFPSPCNITTFSEFDIGATFTP